MTTLLLRLLVPGFQSGDDPDLRLRCGKVAGGFGIATNLLLFAAKLVLGLISGSLSILADSVNNLADSASSILTLVGFKLAAKPADEDHPYGHARYEYITGFVVSLLVLLIGAEFLKSSIGKIISPEPVVFSWLLVGILVGSILLKLWQGSVYRTLGNKINSSALLATAADSRNDVISTTVVLLGCLIAEFTGLLLDGWMGLFVAIFILISGVGLARDLLDPLLGMAPDKKLVEELESRILSYPSVLGLHDLLVHTYGEGRIFASVHVELPAEQDILISHDLIDRIEHKIAREMKVQLVIHLDPVQQDAPLAVLRSCLTEVAGSIDPALDVHDIHLRDYRGRECLLFEVTVPPAFETDDDALRKTLHRGLLSHGHSWDCVITIDRSYTSTTGEASL